MAQQMIAAEELMRDIYQAESAQRWFEQKYGLLSETFYRLYNQGQLSDEDPNEIREYLEWAGWHEIYQDRRRRYDLAIEQQIKSLRTPASLLDLHIHQIKVPA